MIVIASSKDIYIGIYSQICLPKKVTKAIKFSLPVYESEHFPTFVHTGHHVSYFPVYL